MAQLRRIDGKGQRPPVLGGEADHAPVMIDAGHLGLMRVDQIKLAIVAGPADAVARLQGHLRRGVGLEPRRDAAAGIEGMMMPVPVLQQYMPALAADDAVTLSGGKARSAQITPEHHDLALAVA